jgi:hypothetical protein
MSKYKFKILSEAILQWCPFYLGYPFRKPYLPDLVVSFDKSAEFSGEFDNAEKTIFIYYYQIRSVFDLVRTVIHEYTHYVQLYNIEEDRKYTRLEEKLGYWDHPFEIEARENEEKYMRHIYNRIKKLI